jgi:hypothetical protein
MENVRSVLVDQDARVVEVVVGVAGDVVPLLDDEHLLVVLAGESLGQHAPRKSRPNHHVIEHCRVPLA